MRDRVKQFDAEASVGIARFVPDPSRIRQKQAQTAVARVLKHLKHGSQLDGLVHEILQIQEV